MKKLLSLVGIALAISSCGPIYDTTYQFIPPNSEGGRACVYQCENSRSQCRQIEDLRVDRCEQDSRYEQRRCEDDVYRREGRGPKWHECGGLVCTPEYDRCDDQYRSCYQSCGGTVQAETRCVANCEKVPPPPPPPPAPASTKKLKKK